MILYCAVIILGMAAISALNIFFGAPAFGYSYLYCVLATVINTAAVILTDGVFAFIIRRLPQKWFDFRKKTFTVPQKEKRFYEKIGIKKWKDKIPELGGFTKFSKSKISDPFNNEYVGRYLLEACYGTVIHYVTCFTGFLIIFICPLKYWFCFGFPVAIVNAVLNLLPAFTLRYNTYKLNVLYKRNERRNAIKEE